MYFVELSCYRSLGQAFSNLGAFSKGKIAGYKLLEIIRQKPTIVHDHKDGKLLAEVHGNIEFKDVTFSYPSRPDAMIFRDFSLFFPAGKTVAVVGGSGSGKSTVVALIERFYDRSLAFPIVFVSIISHQHYIRCLNFLCFRNLIPIMKEDLAMEKILRTSVL